MKKALIAFVLVLGINSIVFSLDESWISLGAAFGNYIESDDNLGDFYMGSLGINFSGYSFFDQKNVGMFYNFGLLFPSVHNMENNFNPSPLQADFLFGVGFRYSFSERLKLHYGIGFNAFLSSFMDRVDREHKTIDRKIGLGLGGDIGIKYDLTDIIYLDFGTSVTYNFVNFSSTESTADNWTNTKQGFSGWSNGFSMVGIKPYIAIGFNYYQEEGKWGKPKTE